MLIKKLLNKFNSYTLNEKSDKLSNFNLTFELDSFPKLSTFYEIEELLKEFPERDLVEICIKSSDEDFFNIVMQNSVLKYKGPEYIVHSDNISEILKEFNELSTISNEIQIKVRIEKNYKDGIISIYLLDDFINWITDKDIYEIMTLFSNFYGYKNDITFISYDEKIKVLTETFQIIQNGELINKNLIDRQHILKARLDIVNVQKFELNIIPEDFNIKEYEYKNGKLENKLNNIRDILSIIYISNISLINNKFLEFRINGYKSTEFKISYEEIKNRVKNNYLYEIYKWIYNDGNLIDKSTIARNIISLHCRYQNILDIDDESINSIKTNYSYYLKTNTNDFLEEKKNLRLSIIEEGKLLSTALYGFIDSVRKSLLAYLTFLATLIISNTFAKGNFQDIFTFDIVHVITLIILGSFVFLLCSNIEANHKKKRTNDYIEDLTVGYGIVLGEENVKRIIDNVKSYKDVKDCFKCKQVKISIVWIVFNIILLLALDWISGEMKIFGIMNFF